MCLRVRSATCSLIMVSMVSKQCIVCWYVITVWDNRGCCLCILLVPVPSCRIHRIHDVRLFHAKGNTLSLNNGPYSHRDMVTWSAYRSRDVRYPLVAAGHTKPFSDLSRTGPGHGFYSLGP